MNTGSRLGAVKKKPKKVAEKKQYRINGIEICAISPEVAILSFMDRMRRDMNVGPAYVSMHYGLVVQQEVKTFMTLYEEGECDD
jgi:hypothetical protein